MITLEEVVQIAVELDLNVSIGEAKEVVVKYNDDNSTDIVAMLHKFSKKNYFYERN